MTGWLGGFSGSLGFVNFWLLHSAINVALLLTLLAATTVPAPPLERAGSSASGASTQPLAATP